MATLTLTEQDYVRLYGPTPAGVPAGGWDNSEPDKLVKTHCCFCGVQCGIQLKVKDEKVVGFEPWEEFPVNRGMLCPKGVKRYLQGGHPDRLLQPLVRGDDGFRAAGWDEAMARVEAGIRAVQSKYGNDAMALLSGRLVCLPDWNPANAARLLQPSHALAELHDVLRDNAEQERSADDAPAHHTRLRMVVGRIRRREHRPAMNPRTTNGCRFVIRIAATRPVARSRSSCSQAARVSRPSPLT